jgi:conjugal transfer mating pair stabilization protein TraN
MKTTFLKSMLGIFILCLAVMLNIKTSEASVLDGAKEWNGHYYKIIEMQMDWSSADKFCKSMGGYLAVPNTREENEILKNMVLSRGKGKNLLYWIGGYSSDKGLWRWVTGQPITNFYDWAKGEPYRSTAKYCIVLADYVDGQWKAYFNEYPELFICEWESKDTAHDSTM